MIQPILTYGAPVWGDHVNRNLIDKLPASLGKQILGVGNSTASCAIFLELDLVPTSYEIDFLRSLYFTRLLKGGQNEMLKDIVNSHRNSKYFNDLKLLEETGSKKRILFRDRVRIELKENCEGKKTLNFFHSILGENRDYLDLSRKIRGGIVWLKMGGWVWQGRKDRDGERKCPLCQEVDSVAQGSATF